MTEKMAKLLQFIEQRLKQTGVAPSYQEMSDHLGLNSKSGVHRTVKALVERGKLKRLPNRARAIVLPSQHIGPEEVTPEERALWQVRTVASELEARQISAAVAARRLKIICGAA